MERFNKKYFTERLVKLKTLEALNLNYKGEYEDALNSLDEIYRNRSFKENELLNPNLTLIMIYVQQGDVMGAQKLINKFYRTDAYYEQVAGQAWILNKRFLEIIIHLELGDVDQAESRIISLTRKYHDQFKSLQNTQIVPFISLLKKYIQNPGIVQSKEFETIVEQTIPWKEQSEEDIIMMSFYAWLKSKMNGEPLYQTTLDLVNG